MCRAEDGRERQQYPSKRDVDHKRGVLAWEYELAEGEEKTIKFGYRVSSPKDKRILMGMKR